MKRPISLPAPLLAFAAAAALTAALSPSGISAQGPTPSDYADQPPVTQSDVPAALDFLRAVGDSGPAGPSPETLGAIALKHGITDRRLAFIGIKFMTGTLLLMPDGPSREEVLRGAGNPSNVPDDSEMAVVRGAYGEIRALQGGK
ncbi:MAG: hypothetical protein LBQ79_10590 [Deltaproteobacteria bacterium]|jgi:hypothetical protein|nr:hypothetical protein [Deltaproteobacteria bacterium]